MDIILKETDTATRHNKEELSKDSATLPTIFKLCELLRTEQINCCHWKSNAAINRSATGENDLDLLVYRRDIQRFTELLCQLGFKEANVLPDEKLPGIRDFYGYDETTARLVHVHAHFQLVLGHDFTKNYHLPIERAYLESAVEGDLFRIPAPEYEFVVFVIRMILKHSTLDAIIMGHGKLSSSERRELEFLLNPITLEKSRGVLEQYLPFIEQELFDACVRSLKPGCSLWKRIWVGQQLQNVLRCCARRSQMKDVLLKLWRRVEYPVLYRFHVRKDKKCMANGGMLIALVGGDGSGKTTAVNNLLVKLSEEFNVKKIHMGKPSWSLATILIRGIIKIGRSLGFYPFVNEGTEPSLDTNFPLFPGYPWLIREVCTARDRYLDYRRARRFASNGGLVICDRFPLSQIKIMDGPQVERVTREIEPNGFIKLLAVIEHHYYQQILLPDLLIVLRVDPEICVQRKTDETPDSVRSRSQEIWNIDWCGTPACIIDGSQSQTKVMSDVMNVVWSNL
jgi:thymidylate kinase